MRILGIDCGAARTGYGVIESDGRRHSLVAAGVITTDPKQPFDRRLGRIASELRQIIHDHAPRAAAVEEVFYAVNVKTALKLAHVRGVVLATLAEADIPLGEYSALAIKTSVVGYGRAEKRQVQLMTCSLLRLPEPVASEDAADALAVAICHANRGALKRRLEVSA